MKRKNYPMYEFQISRKLYQKMLPKLDLVENHFQTTAFDWNQVCENRETIVSLFFKIPEKTLVYGCIHLQELDD